MKIYKSASDFLPHEQGMLFIDFITEYLPDVGGAVEATLRPDCIFANAEGEVDPTLCLELMAQGFAALEGYAAHTRNEPVRKGFLVGVQQLNIKEKKITVGMPLTIRSQVATRIDDFALIDCSVLFAQTLVAEATIKLYIPGSTND